MVRWYWNSWKWTMVDKRIWTNQSYWVQEPMHAISFTGNRMVMQLLPKLYVMWHQDKCWENPWTKKTSNTSKCNNAFYNGDNNWDNSEYVITYLKKIKKLKFPLHGFTTGRAVQLGKPTKWTNRKNAVIYFRFSKMVRCWPKNVQNGLKN